MATNLFPFGPAGIGASAYSSERRRPEQTRRSSSSSGWWTPLFGWSFEPDYIDSSSPGKQEKANQTAPGPEPNHKSDGTRFAPGCFTEEKAKRLRMMTLDTSSFHDAMYHSAIASRLASEFGPARPDM